MRRASCKFLNKCVAPMRNRPQFKSLKHLLRKHQKRVLRVVRLIRKSDLRRNAEYVCVLLLFLALSIRFFYFRAPTRTGIPRSDSEDALQFVRREGNLYEDKEYLLRRETELAEQTICNRRVVHDNVEELRLCGDFPENRARKKIVGLVEVRNVERTITSFLSALGRTVDSVVIIDDHSTDASRNAILEFNSVVGRSEPGKKVVEVLLNKSGDWIRDELLDRELLLTAGRHVGGSHFVVLDYDEYISSNCVENGLIRDAILGLNPGESLYLPWVEVWKSTALQRVLSGDQKMNFLTRRQIAVFADDKQFHYNMENSVARRIGTKSSSRNGTIHVVRCPRNICPQPAKYRGPRSDLGYPSKVKHLSNCAIVEVRFLNLNNILLKSAWYEALGRVMGSRDGVTSGKMVRLIFPQHELRSEEAGNEHGEEVAVSAVPSKLLDGYKDFEANLYNQVETWRAKDLLRWVQNDGAAKFQGLEAVNLIDFGALRTSLLTNKQTRNVLYHVPRIKTGSFVMAVESASVKVISKFLGHLEWSEVQMSEEWRSPGVRLSHRNENLTQYEHWRAEIERKLRQAVRRSTTKAAFVSCAGTSEEFQIALLELLRNEFPYLVVTVLFGNWTPASVSRDSLLWTKAKAFASEAGSHLRVLDIPMQSFGSYAALRWLRDSLTGCVSNGKPCFSLAADAALLSFAEKLHQSRMRKRHDLPLIPVAILIFSLNVGRAGSKYFSDILGSVNNVISANHEPACENGLCSGGGAIRMQNLSLSTSYEFRASVKLPMIRSSVSVTPGKGRKPTFSTKICRGSDFATIVWSEEFSTDDLEHFRPVLDVSSRGGCKLHSIRDVVYAETNANFKSWFYDVVLDELPSSGYSVTVVVIRKYVAAVLKSLYETGYFTSRDGYNWMETAAGVNSNLKIEALQNDAELDAFEKIQSYLFASEARFRHILNTYGWYDWTRRDSRRSVRFIQTRSELLYSRNGSLELLRQLNLEPSSATDKLIGIVADKYRAGTGKRRKMRTTLRECENRVREFLSKVRPSSVEIDDFFRATNRVEGFDYPE